MFLGSEEELAVVYGFMLVNFHVDLVMIILLAHAQFIILVNEDLAFPLELFEVVKEGLVNFLYSVDDDTDEDIVGTHAFFDELIYIISDTP
jgi:hypothetical protein